MDVLTSHRSPLSTQRIIFFGFLFRSVTSILIVATLGRVLSPEDYGFFSLVAVLVVIMREVLDLGVGNLVVREIVENPEREQFIVEGLMGWRAWVSAILTGTLLLLGLIQEDLWRSIVYVSLAVVTPSYITLAQVPSFVARQAMLAPAILGVVLQLLFLTGMFTMIWVGMTGVVFCLLIIVREVLSNASYHLMFRRLVSFRPHIAPVSKEIRGFLFSALTYGGAVLLHGLYFNSDVLLVYLIRGEAELGAYSAAFRAINPILNVPYMLVIPLVPTLTGLARKNMQNFRALVMDMTLIALGVGLVASVAGIITARDIVQILYAGNYIDGPLDAVGAFAWLSVALSATCISAPLVVGLLALHLERQLLLIGATGFGINVLANLLVLPHFGFEAAAVTTAITEVIVCVMMLNAIRKALGFAGKGGWVSVLMPAVVTGGMLFLTDLPPYPTVALGCLMGATSVFAIAISPPGRRAKKCIERHEMPAATDPSP
jgi:O-antigen/teichoic acid export membrane protein